MEKLSKAAKFLQESDQIEGIFKEIEEYEKALSKTYPLDPEDTPDYVSDHAYAFFYAYQHREEAPDIYGCLELHKRLMIGTRLDARQVGAFRTIQVQVGPHIPPNPSVIAYHMDDWQNAVRPLESDPWKNHAMFETIHPFVDGNGRTGRLLWAWDQFRRGNCVGSFLEYHFGDIQKFLTPDAVVYFRCQTEENSEDLFKLRKNIYYAALNREGQKPLLELKHVERLFPDVDKFIERYASGAS
jgi:hypothetical protein